MRLVGKLIATALILLLLCFTILLALLHTRHATSLFTSAFNHFSPYSLTTEQIKYDITAPWQFTFQNLKIEESAKQPQKSKQQASAPLIAKELTIWLSPSKLFQSGWHFDTIFIDGLNLTSDTTIPQLPPVNANRLALSRFNLQTSELRLQNSKIQFDNWRSASHSWLQFQGDFQLAAEKMHWQNMTMSHVLLDGKRERQHWTVYGFSFNWQQASINGQAEYYNQPDDEALILHHLVVSGLKLQDDKDIQTPSFRELTSRLPLPSELPPKIDIRRLDILDSTLEFPEFTLNHGSLSLQNWQWPISHWQQQEAHFSLSADSLRWHDSVLDTPLAELAFSPQQIRIEGISAKMMEGYIRADGTLTPDTLALNQLTVNNIKWFLPEQWPAQWQAASRRFDNIRLAALDIGYAQVTDTHPKRQFQLSGLNASGHDLLLKHNGHYGLWQGQLTASAGFASVKTIAMANPVVNMQSQRGKWQFNELIIPFKNDGLLKANGSLNLHLDGKPWQLHLTADSIPTSVLPQWLKLPLPINGEMDLELVASGLGQHATGLAYSLDGQLTSNFRHTQLTHASTEQLWARWGGKIKNGQTNSGQAVPPLTVSAEAVSTKAATKPQPLSASQLHLRADRGRITLAPVSLQGAGLSATLKGNWDLANPDKQRVTLLATHGCQQLKKEWRGDQQQISQSSSCDGNNI